MLLLYRYLWQYQELRGGGGDPAMEGMATKRSDTNSDLMLQMIQWLKMGVISYKLINYE
jgi:hypothetical protein